MAAASGAARRRGGDDGRGTGDGAALGSPAQLQLHVLRGLDAVVRVFGQQRPDQALERRRADRRQFGQRRRHVAHDRADQAGLRRAGERPPAGRHLVQHAAEGPQVAARVGVAAIELLGRHVLERSDDGAFGGQRRGDGGRLRQGGHRQAAAAVRAGQARGSRQAEVHQLRAGLGEHDVAGLQVAVDDPGAVGAVQGVGDLPADAEDVGQRQRAAREPLGQRLPVDQFHDQIVDSTFAPHVVQSADVRMIERGHRARLALEARADLGVAR